MLGSLPKQLKNFLSLVVPEQYPHSVDESDGIISICLPAEVGKAS